MAERTSEEKRKPRGVLEQGREEAWRTLIAAHTAAVERIERGLLEAGLSPLP